MIKNIIFDFDGVILDSVPVKTEAYSILFKSFPDDIVEKLVKYHELNGGISRYKKIKYFFNELLAKEISEDEVLDYANKYSQITKEELSKEKYIIYETLEYIKKNFNKFNMHIASGADHRDLEYICKKLNFNRFFLSIQGSPKVKTDIVKEILENNGYKKEETILIGDSINDNIAANDNNIKFYGYNNPSLKKFTYIETFVKFSI